MAKQPDIYSQILQQQYEAGRTYATVITGFASAPFINHLLYKYENLNLDIIIGMASKYRGLGGVYRKQILEWLKILAGFVSVTIILFRHYMPM